MTEEERKAYMKAYYQAHREERKAYSKAYHKAHKGEYREYKKAYIESHREENRAYQKAYHKAYHKADVNSSGQTKQSIRTKSQKYLKKHGKKIPGYEIHHCCTYDEPYKFIYCSKEMHLLIHAYLREHNIDADSEHFEQIKHLLDKTVILYGIDEGNHK